MSLKAVVVGGGPAGASAALGLLRRGFDVTVYEQRLAWQGRVCGAFLNAEAIGHLRWLGLYEKAMEAGAVRVSSARLTGLSSHPLDLSLEPKNEALALPRKSLENILLEAVLRLGGRVRMGTRVTKAEKIEDGWEVTTNSPHERSWRGSLVIFADGRFSLVNKNQKKTDGWFGWNSTFKRVNQKPGDLSLHFFNGGYVGIQTFSNNESNVCGLIYHRKNRPLHWDEVFQEIVACQPHFSALVKKAERIASWRSVGPLPFQAFKRPVFESFQVGDAAAVGDPFMGEGIGRALSAGPLLYRACEKSMPINQLRDSRAFLIQYERLWRSSYSRRFLNGSLVRHCIKNPTLFSALRWLLSRYPNWAKHMRDSFHQGFSPHLPEIEIINDNI